MNKYRSLYNTTLSLIINLLLVMGCFILCRVIFLIENLKAFSDLSAGRIWRMFEGGFLFDTSAILYTNLLYIFLMLIPLHYKENVIYQKITRGFCDNQPDCHYYELDGYGLFPIYPSKNDCVRIQRI